MKKLLGSYRYRILRKFENLSKVNKHGLDFLLFLYSALKEADIIWKLVFYLFNIKYIDEEKESVEVLYKKTFMAERQLIIRFVNTIKTHWLGMVTYFDTKLTYGVLEEINSKIQLAKRRARGYQNSKRIINMIFLAPGKFKFDDPPYLRLSRKGTNLNHGFI